MPKATVLTNLVPQKPPNVPTKPLMLATRPKNHPKATKLTVVGKLANLQPSSVNFISSSCVADVGQAPTPNAETGPQESSPQVTSRIDLDEPGYLRLPQVLRLLGISRSGFYKGVKSGIYPRQVKLGPGPKARAVGWPRIAIKQLLHDLGS